MFKSGITGKHEWTGTLRGVSPEKVVEGSVENIYEREGESMKNRFVVVGLMGASLLMGAGSLWAADVRTGVLFDGWYADPLICRYSDGYWIYPTVSDFLNETVIDAFHSDDLKTWTKRPRVLSTNSVSWARCLWAPHAVEKDGRYYLFFGANDPYPVDRKGGDYTPVKEVGLQKYGGIGVAVADRPEGPYADLIGKPLVDQFWNGSQPIDQYVFSWKGEWYMVYGGWGRCTLVRLAPDFKSVLPWPDGKLWRDVTPPDYREGPVMFERKGVWYFMYSSGSWTHDDYCIRYCTASSPMGPFTCRGRILGSQRPIATGAGHHSVLCLPGTDEWYICYHRRPIPNLGRNHRVVCLDRMQFASDGTILPVEMTGGDIPLPEHPRPDFCRAEWQNLNGLWDFRFEGRGRSQAYDRRILVPFGWGSPLSGVKDEGDTAWYRREIAVPAAWKGKRVFVVVGASDHDTDCVFAGIHLGRHSGGYTPFEFELTDYVKWGENQKLEFKVWDPDDRTARHGHYLYGKQGYGNARGIWQTVYLEARADLYVERVAFAPADRNGTVGATVVFSAPAKTKTVCRFELDGRTFNFDVRPGQQFVTGSLKLEKPRFWTLDDPYLYDVRLSLGDDVVSTYFGFRFIGVGKNANGDRCITLNGEPIYLRLCLDQSYHPEGWYTFPTDEFMKNEILISKRLALSGNRVHVKVEVPRKLYWADKLGLLIQADVPNAWGMVSEAMFEEHWKCLDEMIRRDFNHPSIYQWTLFNETWGLYANPNLSMGLAAGKKPNIYPAWAQRKVAEVYLKTKRADPTRLVEEQSACHRDHVITDVVSWHGYEVGWKWDDKIAHHCRISGPGSSGEYIGGYVQGDQPMMNSECGNVWGYKGSTGDCDFTWDYHLMMDAFRRHLKCAGWLYTEHHDVTNEWNGYVRFDRTPKETGIEELFPGMSLRDLHADACLPLDRELCRRFRPGETYAVPVDISLVTDRYAGQMLSLGWRLRYLDGRGGERWSEETRIDALGKAASWQYGHLTDVKVVLPNEAACGTINFTLFADGVPIAKNFTCFHVEGEAAADAKPVRAVWSAGTTNVLGGLKVNGFGKGFFEYEFSTDGDVRCPGAFEATKGGTFLAEVSTKRLNAKDCAVGTEKGGLDFMLGGGTVIRSKNPNSYPQTSVDKYAGEVRVYANGTLIATVPLPDDPADHRGILSWAAQPRDGTLHEAGSYGYLVKAEVPASLVKDGKVTIRLESDRGLAVYGSRFGRYPFGPHLVGLCLDQTDGIILP